MRSTWKKWMAGVAVATTAVLVLSGCSGGSQKGGGGGEHKSQTLTIAAPFDVASFDTGQLDTGTQVQYWMAVYDTLLRVEPDGSLTPNMATEYAYNEGNTVLTVKLRKGIVFSDGTKFTGDVVKANIEHLQHGTGVAVYMAKNVSEVVVVDDLTVEFHLSAPDPAFTYYLGLVAGAMASPAAFGTDAFATTPIGSGPYLLDSKTTIRGSEYSFVRNPDYWNAKAYPYDKYVVKPMADVTARLNAIKSGQANTTDIDTSVLAEAKSSGLGIEQINLNWAGLLIFDREGSINKPLGDPRVRKALNHAIDGDSIVKHILGGHGTQSQQIFNPKSPAFVKGLNKAYPFDPKKAKALLAEAGYPDGFEVVMPEVATDLAAPFVTQQLADVGVKVTWEKVARENLVPEILAGKYAMISFGSSSGQPWRDISKMISPSGAWNPMHSTSPELEALLKDVTLASEKDIDAAYQAVNKYVSDNAWFSVWSFQPAIAVTDANTSTKVQFGSLVPYLANYTPAK